MCVCWQQQWRHVVPRGRRLVHGASEMNCKGASWAVQAFWSAPANLDVSVNTALKVKAGASRKELPSSHSRPAHSAGKQSSCSLAREPIKRPSCVSRNKVTEVFHVYWQWKRDGKTKPVVAENECCSYLASRRRESKAELANLPGWLYNELK